MASDGKSFAVVWTNVWCYARMWSEGSWGSMQRIGGGGTEISLASNGSGYAAVWGENTQVAGSIYRAGAWEAQVTLDASQQDVGAIPKVASDDTHYLAAWAWKPANDLTSRLATCTATGCTWGASASIVGAGATEISLTGNASGYLAAWTGGAGVQGAFFTGNAWGASAPLGSSTSPCTGLSAATNGTSYVVSYRCDKVRTSTYENLSWSERITGGDATSFAKVTSDGAGYAVIFSSSATSRASPSRTGSGAHRVSWEKARHSRRLGPSMRSTAGPSWSQPGRSSAPSGLSPFRIYAQRGL